MTNNDSMEAQCERNRRMVRLFAAMSAGEAAARMQAAGFRPSTRYELAEDFGAFGWAEATGFTDRAERSGFTAGFLDELRRHADEQQRQAQQAERDAVNDRMQAAGAANEPT